MSQNEKELLLKDICARLPYGVNVATPYGKGLLTSIRINDSVEKIGVNIDPVLIRMFSANDVKPYLFPFSSMTEEQKNDLIKNLKSNISVKNEEISFWNLYTANRMDQWKWVFEWCDKNHFDYRGLIPMGLANDATGLNIYSYDT